MELNIINETKSEFVFEIKGEGHTLCNALKNELKDDADVDYATYKIAHPLIGIPRFIIKTKKGSPRKAILKAIERLKQKNKDFVREFKRAIK